MQLYLQTLPTWSWNGTVYKVSEVAPKADDLATLGRRLNAQFTKLATQIGVSERVAKGVLGLGGAVMAGVAQFQAGWIWNEIGIAGCVLAFLAGLYTILTDRNAVEALALADEALERAREASQEAAALLTSEDVFQLYQSDFERLVGVYKVAMTARAAIEEATRTADVSVEKLVETILKMSGGYVAIGLGFEMAQEWTICIYRAEQIDGEMQLRCIAHHRAVECSVDHARRWKVGTGIAGVAYSNRNEVVIPDMHAEGLSAVYGTGANVKKEEDSYRYRSMAAVPVLLGAEAVWGIVTATSDRPEHFRADQDGDAVGTVEPLRTLANMIALGLACVREDSPPVKR